MRFLKDIFIKSRMIIENFNEKIKVDVTSLIENIIPFFQEIYKKSDLKSKIEVYEKKFQLIFEENDLGGIMKLFMTLLKDSNIQEFVTDILEKTLENGEAFLFTTGLVDENLYKELELRLGEAKYKDPKTCREIIKKYQNSHKNLISINIITNSILIFRESFSKEDETQKNIENLQSLNFLRKKYEDIVEILKDCNEKQLKIFLFDWIVKYGFVIESHTKNILKFLLKLDNLLKDKYFDVESFNLSSLLFHLKQDNIINKFRNAIFHSDFEIIYKTEFDEISIIFHTNARDVNITIKEFIENYGKIILIYNTFELFLMSIDFEKNDIIEFLREFFNQINSISEETLLSEAREAINDLSKMIGREELVKLIPLLENNGAEEKKTS